MRGKCFRFSREAVRIEVKRLCLLEASMHTAARPKSSKNDTKKKFLGANLETGLTSTAEAGSSKTGSIFEEPLATGFSTEVSNEEKYQLIAEASYFRSEKRSFAPGYELEDWLAAETELETRLPRIGSSVGNECNADKRPRHR
jgi:hypothetical protein